MIIKTIKNWFNSNRPEQTTINLHGGKVVLKYDEVRLEIRIVDFESKFVKYVKKEDSMYSYKIQTPTIWNYDPHDQIIKEKNNFVQGLPHPLSSSWVIFFTRMKLRTRVDIDDLKETLLEELNLFIQRDDKKNYELSDLLLGLDELFIQTAMYSNQVKSKLTNLAGGSTIELDWVPESRLTEEEIQEALKNFKLT